MFYKVRYVSSLVTRRGNCDISCKKHHQVRAMASFILHVWQLYWSTLSQHLEGNVSLHSCPLILLLWATAIIMCCQCMNKPCPGQRICSLVLRFKQRKAGWGLGMRLAYMKAMQKKSPNAQDILQETPHQLHQTSDQEIITAVIQPENLTRN